MTNNLPSLNLDAGPYMSEAESAEQIARLFYQLDATPPKGMAQAAKDLRRHTMQLERVNLARCNGVKQPDGFMGFTSENEQQADRMERAAVTAIRNLIRDMLPPEHDDRVAIEFQGDPRGAPVLVHVGEREQVARFW